MAIVPGSFSGEQDLYRMAALARQFQADYLHVIDLPYRLSSWALEDPENICLWFDEQRLVAWAVLQTPFWTIDIVCHPDFASHLYPDLLAWADERARQTINTPYGRPAWFVNVFSGQTDRIRDLEKAGFSCQSDVGADSWSKVFMRRALPTPVKAYLPPAGFTVRPLAGEIDVERYVDLHQSVFESKNMTVDWRRHTLRHPAYRPDLDLIVESADGCLAAFCIGWFDENRHVGQIEPLGCHKNYRQFALGRVALSACLQRLQALGAQEIFVETDNYRNTAFRLYRSFDFEVIRQVLVYRKDIQGV